MLCLPKQLPALPPFHAGLSTSAHVAHKGSAVLGPGAMAARQRSSASLLPAVALMAAWMIAAAGMAALAGRAGHAGNGLIINCIDNFNCMASHRCVMFPCHFMAHLTQRASRCVSLLPARQVAQLLRKTTTPGWGWNPWWLGTSTSRCAAVIPACPVVSWHT